MMIGIEIRTQAGGNQDQHFLHSKWLQKNCTFLKRCCFSLLEGIFVDIFISITYWRGMNDVAYRCVTKPFRFYQPVLLSSTKETWKVNILTRQWKLWQRELTPLCGGQRARSHEWSGMFIYNYPWKFNSPSYTQKLQASFLPIPN